MTVFDSGVDGLDEVIVHGTEHDDVIDLAGETLRLGLQTITLLADLAGLEVNAGDGNDHVLAGDLASPVEQLVLDGGSGSDVVAVGLLSPATGSVSVVPGSDPEETDTVQALLSLSGRVFDDLDNDGAFDSDDLGLADIAVTLFNAADEAVAGATTDAQGQYTFSGAFAVGMYRVVAVRPAGYLDGRETAGTLGGLVDNSRDHDAIDQIMLQAGSPAAVDYLFARIRPSTAYGLVWEDFNDDGEVNFGEAAIDDVLLELTGLDDRGNLVSRTALTDFDGVYSFAGLRPSGVDGYVLREHQPAGRPDGKDAIGEVNGTLAGHLQSNDTIAGIIIPRPASIAANYNFGERAPIGAPVTGGQTAGIGFWRNKHGQALIKSLNGGATATQLGHWLAATLPNLYGAAAEGNNLAGQTNAQVAAFFQLLFSDSKLEAQVLATALAVYVTNSTLAGNAAVGYGFTVSQYGAGVATFNVGARGSAFGLPDHSIATVLDLLLAVNFRSHRGRLFDLDHDGDADDSLETWYRNMTKEVFGAINEAGGI